MVICRSTACVLVAAGLIAGLAGRLPAQVFQSDFELSASVHLDEPDSATRAHLERVKALVSDRQLDEAVELLRQLGETAGSKVVELAEPKYFSVTGFRRYVTLADYCHVQIASLPAEGLALYRRRVDPLARGWYEEGIARRDVALLDKVVNEAFCSSWGDKALLALGEIALEKGQPAAARAIWQRIVERPWERIPAAIYESVRDREDLPAEHRKAWSEWYTKGESSDAYRLVRDRPITDATANVLLETGRAAGLPATRLAYPGTTIDLAEVRARLILSSILLGQLERSRDELAALRSLHAKARGNIAGQEGVYADVLERLIVAAEKWRPAIEPSEWPTLAGSPTRSRIGKPAIDIAGPAWPAISLGEPLVQNLHHSYAYNTRRVGEEPRALLSYHPVVVDDLLLIATSSRILAFSLTTGKPAWPGNGSRPPGEIFSDEAHLGPTSRNGQQVGVPRFTMTVSGRKLFARVGSQVTVRPLESFDTRTGYLVCLDLDAQGRLLWTAKPDGEKWAFEGAPLVDGAELYVGMRQSDVRPQSCVAAFDVETGARRWRTVVCSAESQGGGVEELTHNLLTLHDGVLYYNTNLGAVAALSARDGRLRWITLYERAKRSDSSEHSRPATHFYRDLNPCVYHEGRLFVAPADSMPVFALDAGSGQFLWDSPVHDVIHLLGVGGEKLLASGDRLYWIDVNTGKASWFPDSPRGSETTLGHGRGLLSGGRVYWPTRDRLYVFDQAPDAPGAAGRQQAPIPLAGDRAATGGNLVLANGHLVVAAAAKVHAFRIEPSPAAAARNEP